MSGQSEGSYFRYRRHGSLWNGFHLGQGISNNVSRLKSTWNLLSVRHGVPYNGCFHAFLRSRNEVKRKFKYLLKHLEARARCKNCRGFFTSVLNLSHFLPASST